MAKTIARCFYLLLLLCSQAGAQQKPDAQPGPVVSVERQDGTFKVDASVLLPVPPCQAYALLTDYNSLPDYIPGMLEVSFVRLSDTVVKVSQVAEAKILFFSIEVKTVLEMEEIPNQRILFKLLEGDLKAYSGEWSLQEVPEGTKLTFNASLIFDRYIPTFLGRSILEDETAKRFAAVAIEAAARKNRTYPNCDAPK